MNPLFNDNLKLFRSPNQYSILIMSFGYQFITDPKFRNLKESPPLDPERPIPSDDGRPFRFSLFQRFAHTLTKEHSDLLFGERDLQLLIYILHCYVLNNSLDKETIAKIVKNLQLNLTESELMALTEARVGNLARSLKMLNGQFTEFEKIVSKIYIEKARYREENRRRDREEEEEEGRVSKENIFLREVLEEMGKEYKEEELLEDALYKADFYIPKARLAIEINGKSHFYPYTTRFNNFTNMKMKGLKQAGYNILNLNSWMLEGFILNNNREGMKDLLTKTITTYEANPNLTAEREAARKAKYDN